MQAFLSLSISELLQSTRAAARSPEEQHMTGKNQTKCIHIMHNDTIDRGVVIPVHRNTI